MSYDDGCRDDKGRLGGGEINDDESLSCSADIKWHERNGITNCFK